MMPKAGEIETRLRERFGDGAVYDTRHVIEELARDFQLSAEELAETDGSHPRFEHKVHTALARHCKLKVLVRPARGSFRYVPEKLDNFKPRHHPPRTRAVPKSLDESMTVAEALRRLKRKRRAITLAIRELEQGSL